MGEKQRTNSGLPLCGKLMVFGLLLLAPTTTIAAVAGVSPARSVLIPELQSSWRFDCYSDGQACRGTGNTGGGGHGADSTCYPISGKGCTRFSYNGGGQFKLCLYSADGCPADHVITSVNGGTVSCMAVGGAKSYNVVNRDHNCGE